MNNKQLFIILGVLISLDFITTYHGVFYMGATELNPLYKYCDSIYQWLGIKFSITILCFTLLVFLNDKEHERTIKGCLTILTILYFCVVISNLVQIAINI